MYIEYIVNMDNLLYERCGILTVCLTDPLSQLINKIRYINGDDPNAVGFYYSIELQGSIKSAVILFNTYDNTHVSWLKLGYTMDMLLESPFIKRVTFYPMILEQTNKTGILLSRATMLKTINNNLEDVFRTTIVETIGKNRIVYDKSNTYTSMLLGISNTNITGYSLINKVLLKLMDIKQDNISTTDIIPCPLLKPPISISQNNIQTEFNVKYVVEQSRNEINILTDVFVDLFSTNTAFREKIIYETNNCYEGVKNLNDLFTCEEELVSRIISGLRDGIINNSLLNNSIKNLTNERFKLIESNKTYHTRPLPISANPSDKVNIIKDDTMCTFKQSALITDNNHLKDIGDYINHIIDCVNNTEPVIINLGGMISSYNNAIKGTNLSPIAINVNKDINHVISRNAVIVIPNSVTTLDILPGTIETIDSYISIPMYNSNLTTLSNDQLLDILVYIDSIKYKNGSRDNKYDNIQNEITYELSRRTDS